MKIKFKIILLAVVSLGIFGVAKNSLAATYFIAQNQAGSGSGADCSNARAIAAISYVAGDTIHLCGILNSQMTVGADNITLIFEQNAKFSKATWVDNTGVISCNNHSGLTIDGGINGIIEATDNGSPTTTTPAGSFSNQNSISGVSLYFCDNAEVKNLTIKNMYVRVADSNDSNSYGSGIYATAGNNIKIHDNTINDAFVGIAVSYPGGQTHADVAVYNNYIYSTSAGMRIGSGNTGAVLNNVSLHDNRIHNGAAWNGNWTPPPGDGHFHGDGIHVWAVHSGSAINGLDIYNNEISDWVLSTSWVYMEGNGISNVNVFNNLLTGSTIGYPTMGFICVSGPTNVKIYNNTINRKDGGGSGILASGTGIVDIKNNIMYAGGGIIAYDSVTLTSDNNIFYGFMSDYNDDFYTVDSGNNYSPHTLGYWQSTLGRDIHSAEIDPKLTAENELQSDSPAKDAGLTLSAYFSIDKNGVSRPQGSAWDIGAYEYTGGLANKSADLNGDHIVNIFDYTLFAQNFGQTGTNIADINNDNKVDIFDYTLFAGEFGKNV